MHAKGQSPDVGPSFSRGALRLEIASGMVGPVAFTVAWVFCSIRQEGVGGYTYRTEHISGLAAPDAACRRIMTAGLVGLGASMFPFAAALRSLLGGAAGSVPRLLRVVGLAALAAGFLGRDRMLLGPPPDDPAWRQSGRNDLHDLASGIAYAGTVAIPAALGHTVRRDPTWGWLSRPAAIVSISTASLLALFGSGGAQAYGGIVQRGMVTLPLGAMAAFAGVLLARDVDAVHNHRL